MIACTQTHRFSEIFGLEKAIDLLVDAGFKALDLSFFASPDLLTSPSWKEDAAALRRRVEDRGAAFVQAHAPFGGGYEHYSSITAPMLPHVLEYAAALGVQDLVVHPLQRGRYYGHEKELFEENVRFYRALAPAAKATGVRVAIENMWQHHPISRNIVDDVCADPHELAALYDELSAPDAFTVCLDLGHAAICGREPWDCIRILGPRLGALHVHDVDYVGDLHVLPGIGKINWEETCRALADIGYAGFFTLESDNFVNNFEPDFLPTVARFMHDRAQHLADKVERHKATHSKP